jgi:hypothetical protein
VRLSIEPIGTQHKESLKALLGPFGLPENIVEWKYFGRAFGDSTTTGFVWVKHGAVRGAIGLIPFCLNTPSGRLRAAWTCDWVVDSPQSNPGVGVMLLHHARDAAGPLFNLGGTDANQALTRRLAPQWFPDASIELHVPLRAGGSTWFQGLDRRLGGVLRPLRSVALRRLAARKKASIEPGVSDWLEGLLDAGRTHSTIPVYDLRYLKWQIERCPGVESVTCRIERGNTLAGALAWHAKSDRRSWRVALWTKSESHEETRNVLDAVIDFVSRQGGHRVSTIASRLDRERLASLRAAGFIESGQPRSLFAIASEHAVHDEPGGLSFLDTDLAYRF